MSLLCGPYGWETLMVFPHEGGVAQLAERGSHKPYVGGSTPPAATIFYRYLAHMSKNGKSLGAGFGAGWNWKEETFLRK